MAGTRTLGRTRLDKGLVERCHQMDIYNCGQLLRCSVPELVQRLDIWPEVARQMLIDVGEQIVTDPVTVSSHANRHRPGTADQPRPLPTASCRCRSRCGCRSGWTR